MSSGNFIEKEFYLESIRLVVEFPKAKVMVNFLGLLLAGASIGWVVGLSSSPVVGAVLSTVMAAVVSAISLFPKINNLKDKQQTQEPRTNTCAGQQRRISWVCFFIVGIAVGATGGLSARLHNLLGPQFESYLHGINEELKYWSKLGVAKESVVQDLYSKYLGEISRVRQEKWKSGGLQSVESTGFCDKVATLNRESESYSDDIRNQILASNVLGLKAIRNDVSDEKIVLAIQEICNEND
ncbi:hypothetical protein [Roseibium aggregatum]|uniref:Uncharacterized protein n=1 Tax=Roseibium aggregatum TaxID=187304 RepID=A0A939EAE6_9HYPH|nr:hypothetical protein [Roseibium aggregatum]MBN9669303.1 hypothetical protein [Roseibium aggregatum]